MNFLADSLMPLQQKISERTAYLGFLAALAVYFLAMFMPWASVPVIVPGMDGGSSSGWSEVAYLPVLPFAALFLNGLPGRRALKMNILVLCILLAFALLLVDNVEHRTVWLTPMLVDAQTPAPHAIYGSVLDVGFWFALAAMVAMSVFGLVWTMHKASDAAGVDAAAMGVTGLKA